MKKLLLIAPVVAFLVVLLKFGTISPCGIVRAEIRQEAEREGGFGGFLASALPDVVIDGMLVAQYGSLSPARCIALAITGVSPPPPAPAAQPRTSTPAVNLGGLTGTLPSLPVGQGACLREDQDHIVLERRFINLGENGNPHFYDVAVLGRVDKFKIGEGRFIGATEFTLFRAGPTPTCEVVYRQTFEGYNSGRVETAVLGTMPVVQLIGAAFGASQNSYTHVLLMPTPSGFSRITRFALIHSNMGGFYVGDLGSGRGQGIALWDAIWDSGAHYSPHRYSITFYRWAGSEFLSPERIVTSQEFNPAPNEATVKLGWTVRDQTDQDRFARVLP